MAHATMDETGFITRAAGEALEAWRRVKLNSSGAAVYADATEKGIGTTERAVASGEDVAIRLWNVAGTRKVIPNGTITALARCYAAPDGKVGAGGFGEPLGRLAAAGAAGIAAELLPDPLTTADKALMVEFFDDCFNLDADEGQLIVTADAGSTGGQGVVDGVGGLIALFTDGDDNDEAYLHTANEAFKFANAKPLYFETRLAIVEGSTNAAAVIIGLMDAAGADALLDTEGGPKASYSGIVFYKVAGGLTLSAEASIAGTQTAITLTGATYVSGTFYKFGIEFIPTSSTVATVNLYIDDVLVGSTAAFTYTSATEMDLIVGAKSNGSAEERLTVDYILCRQLR